MFYEIIVNDSVLAVVGHPRVLVFHLSLSISKGQPTICPTAECEEDDGFYLYDWPSYPLSTQDSVAFRKVAEPDNVQAPIRKYRIKHRDIKQDNG